MLKETGSQDEKTAGWSGSGALVLNHNSTMASQRSQPSRLGASLVRGSAGATNRPRVCFMGQRHSISGDCRKGGRSGAAPRALPKVQRYYRLLSLIASVC